MVATLSPTAPQLRGLQRGVGAEAWRALCMHACTGAACASFGCACTCLALATQEEQIKNSFQRHVRDVLAGKHNSDMEMTIPEAVGRKNITLEYYRYLTAMVRRQAAGQGSMGRATALASKAMQHACVCAEGTQSSVWLHGRALPWRHNVRPCMHACVRACAADDAHLQRPQGRAEHGARGRHGQP